jgi:hypothetical protein
MSVLARRKPGWTSCANPDAMETSTVSEYDHVEKLAVTLADCLAELDRLEAHIAAAHLDSALQALHRHAPALRKVSNPE